MCLFLDKGSQASLQAEIIVLQKCSYFELNHMLAFNVHLVFPGFIITLLYASLKMQYFPLINSLPFTLSVENYQALDFQRELLLIKYLLFLFLNLSGSE